MSFNQPKPKTESIVKMVEIGIWWVFKNYKKQHNDQVTCEKVETS